MMYLPLHEGIKWEKWMKGKVGRCHRVGEDMFGHNGERVTSIQETKAKTA